MEDIDLNLIELGLPPRVAYWLLRRVPENEIIRTVLDTYNDDLTLGVLVDRFRYRDIPIRSHWRDTAFAPPFSLAEALFELGVAEEVIYAR